MRPNVDKFCFAPGAGYLAVGQLEYYYLIIRVLHEIIESRYKSCSLYYIFASTYTLC